MADNGRRPHDFRNLEIPPHHLAKTAALGCRLGKEPCLRYAALDARGVDVTLEIVPEMQHVFQFLAGTAPEGDAAIRRLAAWVRPKLGLG